MPRLGFRSTEGLRTGLGGVLPRATPTCSDAALLGGLRDAPWRGQQPENMSQGWSQGWRPLASGQSGQARGEPASTAPELEGTGFVWEHWGPGGDAVGSVTCSLHCCSTARPQPLPLPPGTMSRPSWPLPGSVHPDSITTCNVFPTAPSGPWSCHRIPLVPITRSPLFQGNKLPAVNTLPAAPSSPVWHC